MKLRLEETAEVLAEMLEQRCPGGEAALERTRARVKFVKRQVDTYTKPPWEGLLLYSLARQYNRPSARILEIGTAWGYSAAILAEAAPQASITTLNPKAKEFPIARRNLADYANVSVVQTTSAEWLKQSAPIYDMIFVDGDHTVAGVRADVPYFGVLRPGGLLLFHDYSPAGAKRPTPGVYQVVWERAVALDRVPDVLVVDEGLVGMAGFVSGGIDS